VSTTNQVLRIFVLLDLLPLARKGNKKDVPETLDGWTHVDESCVGDTKVTSAAGIGNSKGKGNWGETCRCNFNSASR
jgi:hypothetical protein